MTPTHLRRLPHDNAHPRRVRIGEVLPSKTVPIPRDNIHMLLSLLLLQCTLAFVTSSSSYVWPVVRHLVGS